MGVSCHRLRDDSSERALRQFTEVLMHGAGIKSRICVWMLSVLFGSVLIRCATLWLFPFTRLELLGYRHDFRFDTGDFFSAGFVTE